MRLKAEQRRLYALLPAEARCFVRVCDDDGALWVSDLPRRMVDCERLKATLRKEGFEVRLDGDARLWYVDWTEERWREMVGELPCELPELPEKDMYHEAYALCRFWLLHPAPLAQEHLPVLRRVTKLTAQPMQKLLRSVRVLHEKAAVQWRSGQTAACDAGRILAAWLNEHAYGKEKEP